MASGKDTDPPSGNAHALLAASLLAAAGGLTDAIVYLDHGHVFANAMTGNTIFMGIAATQGDWAQVVRHLTPLSCFLVGVVAAKLLQSLPIRRSALLVLSCEVVAFLVIGLLPPGFAQLAYTGVVAFVSAFQVAIFRHVGRFTYNSTFVTGNLRVVAEGVYDLWFSKEPGVREKGRAQAFDLGTISVSFFLGAAAGSLVAMHHLIHGLLWAEPLLGSGPFAHLVRTAFRPERRPTLQSPWRRVDVERCKITPHARSTC